MTANAAAAPAKACRGPWGSAERLAGVTHEAMRDQLVAGYGMRPAWRDREAHCAPGTTLQAWPIRPIEAAALREVLSAGCESVLEVGCGEGHLLAEAERVGLMIDAIEPVPAASARVLDRLEGAHAAWGSLTLGMAEERLPSLQAGSHDAVLAVDVLQQVREPAALVREMARVAARVVVLVVPAGWSSDGLDAWCWRTHADLLVGIGADVFRELAVQKHPGPAGRHRFLVVGRVRS